MDCQSEAKELFDELNSWKEESNRQMSKIISSHKSNINDGVKDLVEKVAGLEEDLSVLKKEKTVLLDTVNNLNGEIRQFNAKLESLQNVENKLSPDIQLGKKCNKEKSNVTLEYLKSRDPEINIEHKNNEKRDVIDIHMDGQASPVAITEQMEFEPIIENKDDLTSKDKIENLDSPVCPECKFEFSTIENLRIHMENIHSMSELPQNAGEIRDESNLSEDGSDARSKKPIDTSSDDNKTNKYQCGKCSYRTKYKRDLNNHIKAIHDKIRDRVCKECGYATSNKETLKNHIKAIHDKIRDQVCKECEFATSNKLSLKHHINSVHRKIKNYKCEDCNFATSWSMSLSSHRATVHKIGEPQRKKKKIFFAVTC